MFGGFGCHRLEPQCTFGEDLCSFSDCGTENQNIYFRTQTLLGWAARRGHVELARMLLSNGASLKSRDGRDRTPLHRACSGCHVGIVEVGTFRRVPCVSARAAVVWFCLPRLLLPSVLFVLYCRGLFLFFCLPVQKPQSERGALVT